MVEYDSSDDDEMADEKKKCLSATERKSDGKMNMATEMICDFIFEATNFSPQAEKCIRFWLAKNVVLGWIL